MLEARNISFGYHSSDRLIYEGYSLSIEPGERVELRAPSGFGKTTLCRILAGYEKPQEGQVLVDGANIPKRGACPVQLILQHPELAVDPRMRMSDVLREANRAGVSEAEMERLLDGLGVNRKWLTRFPHELSGGELQRFCVARAFLANPRYLIADEISTMLDAVTQAQIWSFILAEVERREMGLVFVSHSPALAARIATRVELLK